MLPVSPEVKMEIPITLHPNPTWVATPFNVEKSFSSDCRSGNSGGCDACLDIGRDSHIRERPGEDEEFRRLDEYAWEEERTQQSVWSVMSAVVVVAWIAWGRRPSLAPRMASGPTYNAI